MQMNTRTKALITNKELRNCKGFEGCTERELEREKEHIITLARILYNFMSKTKEL